MFNVSIALRCHLRVRLQSKLTPNPNSMSFCLPTFGLETTATSGMGHSNKAAASSATKMVGMSSSLQILDEADENIFERDFNKKAHGKEIDGGGSSSSSSLASFRSDVHRFGNRMRAISKAEEDKQRLVARAKERASLLYTESPSALCELFVPEGFTVDVAHVGMADAHPLSKLLFRDYIKEISSVFIAPQYVTVTKMRQVEWEPKLSWSINSLLSRYASGSLGPVLPDGDFLSAQDDLDINLEKDSEVMQCVKELLKEQVRPMIMADGGDLRLVNLNEVSGILSLRLLGACRSCPSSENTLKNGIERVLQHFLPEITKVVEVKGNVIKPASEGGIDMDNASLFEAVHMNEKSAYKEVAMLDRKRRSQLKGRTASGRYADFDSLSEPDGDDDDE